MDGRRLERATRRLRRKRTKPPPFIGSMQDWESNRQLEGTVTYNPSMHENSLADRRLWWRMYHARHAFTTAADACDYMIKNEIGPGDELGQHLVTAACVNYSQPFKKSQGIEPLSDDFVPKSYCHLHQSIILMRDKMVAHSDANF